MGEAGRKKPLHIDSVSLVLWGNEKSHFLISIDWKSNRMEALVFKLKTALTQKVQHKGPNGTQVFTSIFRTIEFRSAALISWTQAHKQSC